MMGLRLDEGVDLARHATLAGRPLAPRAVEGLEDMGLVARGEARLRLTAAGRPVLNAVLKELIVQ